MHNEEIDGVIYSVPDWRRVYRWHELLDGEKPGPAIDKIVSNVSKWVEKRDYLPSSIRLLICDEKDKYNELMVRFFLQERFKELKEQRESRTENEVTLDAIKRCFKSPGNLFKWPGKNLENEEKESLVYDGLSKNISFDYTE